jgi:hypothetical protein
MFETSFVAEIFNSIGPTMCEWMNNEHYVKSTLFIHCCSHEDIFDICVSSHTHSHAPHSLTTLGLGG